MNPFEIRLQLLKLAQEIENDFVMAERIRIENDWNATVEKTSVPTPFPKMPTVSVEAVIKNADLLNAFVSKKDV